MQKALKNRILSAHAIKGVALLVSLALLLTAVVGSTLSYVVVKTPTLVNRFISGLDPTGDLTVTKVLEHPFGDDYALPDGLTYDFEFYVDGYAGQTVSTSQGDMTVDDYGYLTLSVPNNGSVTIHELEEGTTVWASENLKPGYSVKPSQSDDITDGEDGRSKGLVMARGQNTVQFVNVYAPAPVPDANITVTGEKTLVGRDWQEGDSFTFRLEYETEPDNWFYLGEDTITYSPDHDTFNQFDFTDLVKNVTFDSPGTYSFRVTEVEETLGGVTYDTTSRYFDVVVGDSDMDGYLEIQSVSYQNETVSADENGTYNVFIPIENTYAASGSAEVTIRVRKTMEDRTGQNRTPAGFAFRITDQAGEEVQVSETTTAAGEVEMKLVFDASDAGKTFTYTLTEVGGGTTKNGLRYDGTKHTVRISVIDNKDGTVSATVNGSGSNSAEFRFTNTYAPTAARPELSGTKTLEGREMFAGEFQFNLYETAGDFVIPEGAEPEYVTYNRSNGRIVFADMSFAGVGTWYYVLTEDASAALGGIVYDDAVYNVTVKVTDAGNGTMTAETTVVSGGVPVDTFTFHNVYDVQDDPHESDTPWLTDDHYNYIVGRPDGKVYPEDPVTRAEVASIFYRLLTDEARTEMWCTESFYPDVSESRWYYVAISTLTNGGILKGYPDGTFRPEDPITRAELTTILCRFDTKFGHLDITESFSDTAGHWARKYINHAATRGYILGYTDGTFKPDRNLTRAETIAMVNRLVGRSVDAEGLIPGYIVWPDNDPNAWYYYDIIEATTYHDYERSDRDSKNQPFKAENWLEVLPPIDWAKVEKGWILIQTGK